MLVDFIIEMLFRYLYPTLVYGTLIAGIYLLLRKAGSRFERLSAYLLEDDGRRLSRVAFIVFAGVVLYGVYWIIAHRYHPQLNDSDAGTMHQALYTATHGHLFSDTVLYMANGYYRYASNYYYGSIIATNLYFVPLGVISWAYLLWPESPMHILIPYVMVMLFGGVSFYYIGRAVTGSRATAAYLLMLYVLLPQMRLFAITTVGAYDIYSTPFLLWTLYFLYRGRFAWFTCLAALTFFVSIFAQYIVIMLALGGYWLYREKRYLLLGALGIIFNLATYAVFDATRFCLVTMPSSMHVLGDLFLQFDRSLFLSFLGESASFAVYIAYISPFLILAFFRTRFSMVLLAAITPVFVMVTLRRVGHVENHHNHDIVVMLFFLYAVYLKDGLGGRLSKMQVGRLVTAQLLAYFAVPLFIVVFSAHKYNAFMLNKQTHEVVSATPPYKYDNRMDGSLRETAEALARLVPKDASLCVLTELGNGAMFANRHSIWFIHETKVPRSQFYLLQNSINVFANPRYNGNDIPVASLTKVWGNDLYSIYRNADPEDIPYPHWVMGFAFLKNFGRTDCPQDTQSIVPPLESR